MFNATPESPVNPRTNNQNTTLPCPPIQHETPLAGCTGNKIHVRAAQFYARVLYFTVLYFVPCEYSTVDERDCWNWTWIWNLKPFIPLRCVHAALCMLENPSAALGTKRKTTAIPHAFFPFRFFQATVLSCSRGSYTATQNGMSIDAP